MNLEKILFLDIETVPLTYKYADLGGIEKELWNKKWSFLKDENPEIIYEKAGIYAEFSKIICISIGWMEGDKFKIGTFYGADEKKLLSEFCLFLKIKKADPELKFCAHNGKEFDYPFLCRRILINELTLPMQLQLTGKKPWEVNHYDTMEMWKFGDYKNYTSLNLLAHVFNIPSPKDEIDGSKVAKVFYEENDLEKIKRYCIKDVVTVARLFFKLTNGAQLNEDSIETLN